ncbi:MAG: FAD binding domain-containing protein [Phycisphaerae bacterium]
MYLPDIELHEATSLSEAATLLARHAPDARLLAGGTDLLVDLKTGRVSAAHLVSIRGIDALRGVSQTNGSLRIGARTTITELDQAPVVREGFAPLLDATREMAARQIRNVATVGGNLASAVSCADLPPILIAMNASVVLWSPGGTRTVALEDFFAGPRRTVARQDEILTEVRVPAAPSRAGAAYARFALRDGNAIAVAGVAAGLELDTDGRIATARIVLGAVAPNPMLVDDAAGALVGQHPAGGSFEAAARAAVAAARPISDVRGSAGFRREVVGVLTQRALATAHERIRDVPS